MAMYLMPTRGTIWNVADDVTLDALGFIPMWFANGEDMPSAQVQANQGYMNTGGCPFSPTSVAFDLEKGEGETYALAYADDPPMREVARTQIGDEIVVVFDGAWVAIIQPDESFVVARCD